MVRDGACPECGTRIALSLRDDTLGHANPLWVMRLAQAVTLLFAATVAECICEIVFAFGLPHDVPFGHVLARILGLLLSLYWLSRWVIATPEYVTSGRYRNRGWCWLIRVAATLRLLFYYPLLPFTIHVRWLDPAEPLLAMATTVATWTYLRHLARRLPDGMLYVHAQLAMLALLADEFCVLLMPAMRRLFPNAIPPTPIAVERLIVVLTTGYGAFVLSRFSTRFTRATNQAMGNYIPDSAQMLP